MSLELMYITNRPEVAKIAEINGVNRIWVDLETRGKEERQKGMNTVKSKHTLDDISIIKKNIIKSKLLVRINPIYEKSKEEISEAIKRGADIIMLPMFRDAIEVSRFVEIVNNRAKVLLLLETKEAVDNLDEILCVPGIDEIHIGLNDLHLSYNKKFMFELLADGTVEKLSDKIKNKNIRYGFGGIAGLNGGMLPAKEIVAEHYRLGSEMVILSRSFCDSDIENIEMIKNNFKNGIDKLREYEKWLENAPKDFFIKNREDVIRNVSRIVEEIEK